MKRTLLTWRFLPALLPAVFVLLAGCAGTQTDESPGNDRPVVPVRPAGAPTPPQKSLSQLVADILMNAEGFRTMLAECRVVIESKMLVNVQALELEGELAVGSPRNVRFRLSRTGQTFVDLAGNGTQYFVDMPAIGPTSYEGAYDAPLTPASRRLSILPEEIAEAFDQKWLMVGKTPYLKAYSDMWVVECIKAAGDPPRAAAARTLYINRKPATEIADTVARFDTFNPDGEVRSSVILRDYRNVADSRGNTVLLPYQVRIIYPGEGTVINIELTRVELNYTPKPTTFDLKGKTTPRPATTTTIRRSETP